MTKALETVKALDKLSILMPDQELQLRKKTITLKPFTVNASKKILAKIGVYKALFVDKVEDFYTEEIVNDAGEVETKKIGGFRNKTNAEIADAFLDKAMNADSGLLDDLCFIFGFVCDDLTPEFVDELGIDELALIITQALEMNSDFFKLLFRRIKLAFGIEVEEEKTAVQPVETEAQAT